VADRAHDNPSTNPSQVLSLFVLYLTFRENGRNLDAANDPARAITAGERRTPGLSRTLQAAQAYLEVYPATAQRNHRDWWRTRRPTDDRTRGEG